MYGAIPLEAETVISPSAAPLQVGSVKLELTVIDGGSVRVKVSENVHPALSVTVTVCKPAVRLDAVAVLSPLDQE